MSLARPAACLLLVLAAACAATDADMMHAAPTREAMTATIDRCVAGGRFGGEVWRLNLSERYGEMVCASRISVDGDLLLIEDTAHRIHAIDRASGVHRWPVEIPSGSTQTVGGTASSVTFVCTDDVVAVSRSHGSRMMGSQQAPQTSVHLEFFPSGRGVTIGQSLYIGRLAPYGLQSIDLVAGHAGWSYSTSSPVIDTVVYGDGAIAQIITMTEDGLLFSLPPRHANESAWSPKENWFRRLPGTRPVTPMSLLGDHLVFGTANGFVYDVDARNGGVRWKTGCSGDMHGCEATIAGDAVYQPAGDGVMAYDLASGNELWKLAGASRVITRIGDKVYADMGGGEVALVAAANGHELARFSTEGLMLPTVSGGGALIASDGTNVFAIQ